MEVRAPRTRFPRAPRCSRVPRIGPLAWPIAFLPFLQIALLACSPQTAAADSEGVTGGVREREVPPVRTAAIERQEMVQVLETTSKLESEGEIQLFPRLSGEAVEVLVEEGDEVEQGDVLARLDDRDEVLSLKDAEVALQEAKDRQVLALLAIEEAEGQLETVARNARQAERDYERDLKLSRTTEVASPLSVQALEAKKLEMEQALYEEAQAQIMLRRKKLEEEQAQTEIARAEVALERAHLNVEKKKILAPFDGVIAQRTIRVGDSVGTGEAAFVLTETGTLRAVFSRPQEELGLFSHAGEANGKGNLSITATAEAYPGRVFEGWVERISPTIEPESGQFRVTARLAGPEEAGGARLLPGMLVRMEIVTDRHPDALVVPKRALRREGERRYVLKIEDHGGGDRIVRRIDVEEGYEDEERVEVVPASEAGLGEGDLIVFVGSRDLVDGDPVRIDRTGQPEGAPAGSGEATTTAQAAEAEQE